MRTLFSWGGPIVDQALSLATYACLLLLPLLALVQWRRHKSLRGRWWWLGVTLIFYLVGLVSFTFLPLPEPDQIQCNDGSYYPRFFAGWSLQFALDQTQGLGLKRFFTWPFLQIYLNILLFVPWGMALAWLFKASLRAAMLSGFAASLFIELSQLTGLWGYFPCRYRTFDVDDMISNTLGAIVGWVLLTWISATRQHFFRKR